MQEDMPNIIDIYLNNSNAEGACVTGLAQLGFDTYYQREALMDILFHIVEMENLSSLEYPFARKYKSSLDVMEAVNNFLQRFAFKAGERTDIKPLAMDEGMLANLEEDFIKLGMIKNTYPPHFVYDAALCVGSAEKGVRPRLNCLAKMTRMPIFEIDNIMVLGSSRKLWPLKKTDSGIEFPEPTLYKLLAKRLSERDGKEVTDSDVRNFIVGLDTKETEVDKLAEEVSSHPYFADITWPTEADLMKEIVDENPSFKDKNVIVINAPDYPDGRRADLALTIATAANERPDILNPGAGVLAISSQPFVRHHKQVLKQTLPRGAEVDVIGEGIDTFTPKQAMLCLDSLARTVYSALEYYKIKEKEFEQAKILCEISDKKR